MEKSPVPTLAVNIKPLVHTRSVLLYDYSVHLSSRQLFRALSRDSRPGMGNSLHNTEKSCPK